MSENREDSLESPEKVATAAKAVIADDIADNDAYLVLDAESDDEL